MDAGFGGVQGKGEDREELDFQFDEELDRPLPVVKQNTFTEWSDSEDESECEEVGDDFINKVCVNYIHCYSIAKYFNYLWFGFYRF